MNKKNGMLPRKRQKAILTHLAQQGFASVSELNQKFSVSEMTIRRDLSELEDQGHLQRTYGGAVINEKAFFEITSRAKSMLFVEEKQRIGKMAVSYVNNGDVVILDSGTTTLEVARNLRCMDVTVITNDLQIAHELLDCNNIKVYVIGGELRRGTNNLIGPKADSFFDDIRCDKLFLAVEGVDAKAGLTVPDMLEVPLKRKMVYSAGQVIVVADHSKLGRNTLGIISPLSAVSYLITDTEVSKKNLDELKDKVKVVQV